MKTLKLHELIEKFENCEDAPYEWVAPYKKQLFTYFSEYYGGEPMLMVTVVTNAMQGVIVVPDHMLHETVLEYLNVDYIEEDENSPEYNEDLFSEYETILANSRYLIDVRDWIRPEVQEWIFSYFTMRIIAPKKLVSKYPEIFKKWFVRPIVNGLPVRIYGSMLYFYCNEIPLEHQSLINSIDDITIEVATPEMLEALAKKYEEAFARDCENSKSFF